MNHFLAKTDPETYSIDDLEREKRTVWDGVTNAQAVRVIRQMRAGDHVFIYHSGGVSSVVGMAVVRSEPRDDPKNAKSAVVDLEFAGRLEPPPHCERVHAALLAASTRRGFPSPFSRA